MTDTTEQDTREDVESAEQILCPHCMEPVDPLAHFCAACGGPVGAFASIDPMGQVYSAGHAYRSATSRPTKFIVVLGVWLIFAPQLIILLFVAISILWSMFRYGDSRDLFGFAVSAGLSAIYGLIIYKSTHGYFRGKRCLTWGLCYNCGYDLRGSEGQTHCPECGEPIDRLEDDGEEVLYESS